jgi:hypothetical protein
LKEEACRALGAVVEVVWRPKGGIDWTTEANLDFCQADNPFQTKSDDKQMEDASFCGGSMVGGWM